MSKPDESSTDKNTVRAETELTFGKKEELPAPPKEIILDEDLLPPFENVETEKGFEPPQQEFEEEPFDLCKPEEPTPEMETRFFDPSEDPFAPIKDHMFDDFEPEIDLPEEPGNFDFPGITETFWTEAYYAEADPIEKEPFAPENENLPEPTNEVMTANMPKLLEQEQRDAMEEAIEPQASPKQESKFQSITKAVFNYISDRPLEPMFAAAALVIAIFLILSPPKENSDVTETKKSHKPTTYLMENGNIQFIWDGRDHPSGQNGSWKEIDLIEYEGRSPEKESCEMSEKIKIRIIRLKNTDLIWRGTQPPETGLGKWVETSILYYGGNKSSQTPADELPIECGN